MLHLTTNYSADNLEWFDGKTDIITPPLTPSKWVDNKVKYTPITRLRLSCGGGMGGAQWYENVQRIPLSDIKPNTMLEVTDLEGRKHLVNTRYIVEADSSVTVASVYLDSQNSNFEMGVYEFSWLIKDGRRLYLDGAETVGIEEFSNDEYEKKISNLEINCIDMMASV